MALFVRKFVLVPSWQGWLLFLLLIAGSCALFLFGINPLLSVNSPLRNGYMVIDGSLPDYAIEESIRHFQERRYEKMVVTGGPVPVGSYHLKYTNYAAVGKAKLIKFDFDEEDIITLEVPYSLKDRTYHNAVEVEKWAMDAKPSNVNLTIFEVGAHARRSRLLYEMAFNGKKEIGVIAIEDINYDPMKWWQSSIGFRTVTGECIAYLYVRLFFRP